MNRPKVVDEQVEDAQDQHQKAGAPSGLESDDDHDASSETENRDNDTCQCPFALDDEADEKEDEQNAAGELEVDLAIGFAERRKSGKDVLLGGKAVREHHEQSTYDREVAKEEVEIEDKTVSESLDHDHTEEGSNRDFGVSAHDHGCGGGTHDLLNVTEVAAGQVELQQMQIGTSNEERSKKQDMSARLALRLEAFVGSESLKVMLMRSQWLAQLDGTSVTYNDVS